MTIPTLHIVGAGQLGRSLGRLWQQSGSLRIGKVLCREMDHARAAVRFIGAGDAATALECETGAAIYLLAVPDDSLVPVAKTLAAGDSVFDTSVALHCSGALASDVLEPLARRGAALASVHPLRSFADPARAVRDFAGTWCGIEGEDDALARVRPLFEAIGGRCVGVRSDAKVHYHAAAVVTSNYLVALVESALRLFECAGIERDTALQMLQPLARGALDNVFAQGSLAALSGPILRGDTGTVAAQLAASRSLGLDGMYSELGLVALDLARQRGQADPAALDALHRLLSGANDPARGA